MGGGGEDEVQKGHGPGCPLRPLSGPLPPWPGAPFLLTPLKGAVVRLEVPDSYGGHSFTPQMLFEYPRCAKHFPAYKGNSLIELGAEANAK